MFFFLREIHTYEYVFSFEVSGLSLRVNRVRERGVDEAVNLLTWANRNHSHMFKFPLCGGIGGGKRSERVTLCDKSLLLYGSREDVND